MEISSCNHSDTSAIRQLFLEVFSDSEGPAEGLLIADLARDLISTTADQDIFGFVGREADQIIGSIFFTRLRFDIAVEAFVLAPVAVRTNHQGKGVGQTLIHHGINALRVEGVSLLFTYGDPNYYSRFGFNSISEACISAPFTLSQPEGWLCQSLAGDDIFPLPGRPRCVDALNHPHYW